MRALILFTLFAGQYAAATCPTFESGTYQCQNLQGGMTRSLDLNTTQDADGNPALQLDFEGQPVSNIPLLCMNGTRKTELCTIEQRRLSPEVNAKCSEEMGANKFTISVTGKSSPTAFSAHVSMIASPAAGGGKKTVVADVKMAMRATGPGRLDVSVAVVANGGNETIRLKCVR